MDTRKDVLQITNVARTGVALVAAARMCKKNGNFEGFSSLESLISSLVNLYYAMYVLSQRLKAAIRRCSSKYVFSPILQYSKENTCAGVSFNKVEFY